MILFHSLKFRLVKFDYLRAPKLDGCLLLPELHYPQPVLIVQWDR